MFLVTTCEQGYIFCKLMARTLVKKFSGYQGQKKPDHILTLNNASQDFRNLIIQRYFALNDEIVWETIIHRLPELLKLLRVVTEEMS